MTGGASLDTPAALAGVHHSAWDLASSIVMAGEWPLRDFTELAAVPAAVPWARHRTRQLLAGWRMAAVSEQAELVVSELVTNAVAATQAAAADAPVRLWLLADGARAGVAVWDANPRLPEAAEPGELAENGRGLLLVASLAGHWDACRTPRLGGKVVRAVCAPGG
jgi:anti-sigma regulatory factor (Ser/Thr protein kinase)